MRKLTVFAAVLALAALPAAAFRIVEPGSEEDDDEPGTLLPYEQGFVASYGDLQPAQGHLNPGNQGSLAQPVLFDDVHARQNCPSMVGPSADGLYFCRDERFGVCDRRSGTCFCEAGYAGVDCGDCHPSYYRDDDGDCVPKVFCPNHCSAAGECDFRTGECSCSSFRTGSDCSQSLCATFDSLCEKCTTDGCQVCIDGYFVDPADGSCRSCSMFDPRCWKCTPTACVACADPLLLSTARSGARLFDVALPMEEELRLNSLSQPPEELYFVNAEPFVVVENAASLPLANHSKECVRGLAQDSSLHCDAFPQSHIVCGHQGIMTWTTPALNVTEDAGLVTVTLQRSGGGVGEVAAEVRLVHVTTDDGDVTLSTFYESNSTVIMPAGVVRLSFQLTILQDRLAEGDETFRLILTAATGGVTFGSQSDMLVTIIDDDDTLGGMDTMPLPAETVLTPPPAGDSAGSTDDALPIVVTARTAGGLASESGDAIFVARLRPAEQQSLLLSQLEQRVVLSAVNSSNSNSSSSDGSGDGRLYSASLLPRWAGQLQLDVEQVTAGGLAATYFSDDQFQYPAVQRVDAVLNFTWADNALAPGVSPPASVLWHGWLRPTRTDDFQLRVLCNDQLRVWVDHRLIIDRFLDDSQLDSAVISLQQGVLYPFSLQHRALAQPAELRLLWSTPSLPEQVVPPSALLFSDAVYGSPTEVTVLPGLPHAPTSQLRGTGLTSQTAGETATLTLLLRDAAGQPVPADALSTAQLARLDGVASYTSAGDDALAGTVVQASVQDSGDGQLQLTMTPTLAGDYSLAVSLRTNGLLVPMKGSPFGLTVAAGPPSALRSAVEGDGLTSGQAGSRARMTVTARDAFGNLQSDAADSFNVVIQLLDGGTTLPADVASLGDARYELSYLPSLAGAYRITVAIGNELVQGSPTTATVTASALASDETQVTGSGLREAIVGIPANIAVTLNDRFGNQLASGGQTVVAAASGVDTFTAATTDNGDGTYLLTYTATTAGEYLLDITVNGDRVPGAPTTLLVAPGVPLASESVAFGAGLLLTQAGVRTTFSVQLRDVGGNDVATGGLPLSATMAAPNAQTLAVVDNDDGTYSLTFTASVTSDSTVQVLLDGQPIAGSPFTVSIEPGAASTASLLSLPAAAVVGSVVNVSVQAIDVGGNVIDADSPIFQLTVTHPSGEVQPLALPMLADGLQSGNFTPSAAGDYRVDALLLREHGATLSLCATPDCALGEPLEVRMVDAIDSRWPGGSPGQGLPATQLGAVWEATLLAGFSQRYTLHLQVSPPQRGEDDPQVTLTVDGQTVIHSAVNASCTSLRGDVMLTVGQLHSLRLAVQSPSRMEMLSLSWSSRSQEEQVIPQSALLAPAPLDNSPLTVSVRPAQASTQSLAVGLPQAAVTAGELLEFTIRAVDSDGNTADRGGDSWAVLLRCVESEAAAAPASAATAAAASIVGDVVDAGDGSYAVSLTPIAACEAVLTVALATGITLPSPALASFATEDAVRERAITGAPFTIVVQPAALALTQSSLQSLTSVTAGSQDTTQQLVLRDAFGNAVPGDADVLADIAVSFTHSVSGEALDVAYTWLPAASDSVQLQAVYTVADAATAVQLAFAGQLAVASVQVLPAEAAADTSIISGAALDGVTVGSQASVSIASRDRFDNPLTTGGAAWLLTVQGPAARRAMVSDAGDGTYSAAFTLPEAGAYQLHAALLPAGGLRMHRFSNRAFQADDDGEQVQAVDTPAVTSQDSMLYSARWAGWLVAPSSAMWTLHVRTVGSAHIWLGGERALEGSTGDGDDQLPRSFSLRAQLEAQQAVELRMEWTAAAGAAAQDRLLEVEWESPALPRQPLPASALRQAAEAVRGSPWPLQATV